MAFKELIEPGGVEVYFKEEWGWSFWNWFFKFSGEMKKVDKIIPKNL